MFDQPPSLPMRAAIASLLGGLFGVALILFTHGAQAQTQTPAATAEPPMVLAPIPSRLNRLGEAALQALRATETTAGLGDAGVRAARLDNSAGEAGSGLRWQVTRLPWLRSEGDLPRSRDLVSVGVQLRF